MTRSVPGILLFCWIAGLSSFLHASSEEVRWQLEELQSSIRSFESEKKRESDHLQELVGQARQLEKQLSARSDDDLRSELIGIRYEISNSKEKLAELAELLVRAEVTRDRFQRQLETIKKSELEQVAENANKKTAAQGKVDSAKAEKLALPPKFRTLRGNALTVMEKALQRARSFPAVGVFGDEITLYVNVPGEDNPEKLGMLTHLGGNQYALVVPLKKGRQEFIVGNYHFFKQVPDPYHNLSCLIVVDLLKEEIPSFHIINSQ